MIVLGGVLATLASENVIKPIDVILLVLGGIAVACTVMAVLILAPLFARSDEEYTRTFNHLVRVARILAMAVRMLVSGPGSMDPKKLAFWLNHDPLSGQKMDPLASAAIASSDTDRASLTPNLEITADEGCTQEESKKPLAPEDYRDAFRLAWTMVMRHAEKEPELTIEQVNRFLSQRVDDICSDPRDGVVDYPLHDDGCSRRKRCD
ncbi:hypothetical protein AB0J43_02280 [Nonomuraea fuscirosea]